MLLLKELIRFSTQHRTFYCYMILSIWIFLLIAGMYKYIGHSAAGSLSKTFTLFDANSFGIGSSAAGSGKMVATEIDEETLKFRKFKQVCTPIEHLARHDDGGILEGWKLQGVLLIIRHGDRGPLSHVRAASQINCGVISDALVNRYRSFLYNSTSSSGANHMYWNKVGPFHGFPLLPATDRACHLGQLTYKGIAQLLHVGEILHQIYAHPLGLLYKQAPNKSSMDSTPHSMLNSDEVVLYSTRYRRTFQSALALLFTFLPADKWLALNVRESHSLAFCFTDCACQQAEVLRKRINTKMNELAKESKIAQVISAVGATLLQNTPNGNSNIMEVVDAMVMIICHDATYPCRHTTASSLEQNGTQKNAADLSDVINIDVDENAGNIVDANAVPSLVVGGGSDFAGGYNGEGGQNAEGVAAAEGGGGVGVEHCLEQSHISALITHATKQSTNDAHHPFYKRIGLMRGYGMMRHIVSYMLRMISGDRTKLVLYSGHDWTLQFITAALGIKVENTFVPYAARLAFELYKSEAHTDYYFRVVYNGRDVTQQIDFCEGGKSLRVTRDSRGNKADLCPIENIIRFLHEDYFSSLNATNFKDACSVLTQQVGNEF